jgi:hypothetical protein
MSAGGCCKGQACGRHDQHSRRKSRSASWSFFSNGQPFYCGDLAMMTPRKIHTANFSALKACVCTIGQVGLPGSTRPVCKFTRVHLPIFFLVSCSFILIIIKHNELLFFNPPIKSGELAVFVSMHAYISNATATAGGFLFSCFL